MNAIFIRNAVCSTLVAALLLSSAACSNRAQTGAGAGALGGAVIGALTTKNKALGAGIGAGIGLALGYIIGNEWDKHDEQQLNGTLEQNRTGQTSSWRNPDSGAYYQATPSAAYQRDDKVYRDVNIKATTPDGKTENVKATAYRQPDGTWRLVQ